MTYGAKIISPVEVGVSLHHCIHFNEINNDEARKYELHLLEKIMDASQVKLAAYQRKMAHYYNAQVRN